VIVRVRQPAHDDLGSARRHERIGFDGVAFDAIVRREVQEAIPPRDAVAAGASKSLLEICLAVSVGVAEGEHAADDGAVA